MTRRLLIPALLLLLSVSSFAGSAAGDSGDVPKIKIKEKNFSFPKSPRGPKLTHAFKIQNVGKKDLIIYSVKPSCGCTVAQFDELIRAGEQGSIILTLDTNRLHGSFSKSATVKTNDPERAEFRLQVAGEVISPFKISPRENIFLHAVEGESTRDKFFIGAEDGGGFKILRVTSSLNEYIDYELKDVIKGEKYMLSVWTKPESKAGVYSGKILIETDNPESPKITVDVSVNIRGFVNVSPRMINFGTVKRGQNKFHTRTLRVELAKGNDLELLEVTTGSPYFRIVETKTVDQGRIYTLSVELIALPPAEELSKGNQFKDKLIVRTNKKGYEEIDVDLKLAVK